MSDKEKQLIYMKSFNDIMKTTLTQQKSTDACFEYRSIKFFILILAKGTVKADVAA